VSFSVVSPVVMLAAVVYFQLAAMTFGWAFENIYGERVEGSPHKVQHWESHGRIWNELFTVSMVGLVMCTMTVSAFTVAKTWSLRGEFTLEAWIECVALVLLHVGILRFWTFCDRTYRFYSDVMPVEDAGMVDSESHQQAVVARFRRDYFQDPLLRHLDAQPQPPGVAATGAGRCRCGRRNQHAAGVAATEKIAEEELAKDGRAATVAEVAVEIHL